MTFPNLSHFYSGKLENCCLAKESSVTGYFFMNLQSSKLYYHVTTHLRENYAEVFCIFLGNRGNLAGCLTCNNQLALFRVGVLDWRWIWVCGIFEYSSLFSGLKRVRPVFPLMSDKWLKSPVCTSDVVGGTVQKQFIPARLWVTTPCHSQGDLR